MLKLFVLRHGKAIKPQENIRDFDRYLNKKGTAQVNQVGYILRETQAEIVQIITSGARRTSETAEIMNYYLQTDNIIYDDELYLTSYTEILRLLAQHATAKSVLLVGHNFGLSHFVNYLTDDQLNLSTSMLVEINFNFDDWNMLSASTGTIEQIIVPQVHSF